MYAIIKTGGKQYRVKPGDELEVEKLKAEVGSTIDLGHVLAAYYDSKFIVGHPYIKGTEVKAEVLEHGKSPKIIVYKYKPKKKYRRKQGHRQPYTKVKILSIDVNQDLGDLDQQEEESKEA